MQYLTDQHFNLIGNQVKTLGITLPGFVLVYFKTQACPNCTKFDPVFKQLSMVENKVSYAVADVYQNNKSIVSKSRATTTPISAVPMLILYINGRPHAKFSGTLNLASLRGFIEKALESAKNAAPPAQKQFMGQTSSNMYGGYNNPQQPPKMMSPNQGYHMPDIGNTPPTNSSVKGNMSNFGGAEEEDERLLIPESVIPYNMPWEAEYRKLNM
jgi:hypothetical protein